MVLRPVVSFCLRNGLRIQDVTSNIREAFLEMAIEQLKAEGIEVSASRLSVATGIHRKFIPGLLKQRTSNGTSRSLLIRLIEIWQRDRRFSKDKSPKPLSVQYPDGEFFALVDRVSADLNPYTVLSELERRGVVLRHEDSITLKEQFLVVKEDLVEALNVVSSDSCDLLKATEENLKVSEEKRNLQLSTEYDNIAVIHAQEIRNWMLSEGSALHARARSFLAPLDRDLSEQVETGHDRIRVKLAAFSLIEDISQKIDPK